MRTLNISARSFKKRGTLESTTFKGVLAKIFFFVSQSDCQVHLRPTLNPPNLEEYLSAVQVAQVPSQLNKYRIYLSVARALNYTISDEITKVSILSHLYFSSALYSTDRFKADSQ